ncbi:MAG: hypothetical protein JNJ43_12560 [Anaerolineales bacterium]|nr:hypothetical protein [Anaerolineales bacterium]
MARLAINFMPNANSKQRIIIIGLTILGCLLILFFGLRAFRAFQKFDRHGPPPGDFPEKLETDVERVRDWMTIPFISRMYGVPEPILYDALGISPEGNYKKSLRDLNKEYFPENDGIVIEIVKATLLANQSPPTPLPPLTPIPPSAP